MKDFKLYFADGSQLKSNKTLIMGILNATPDSFSDGGEIADKAVLKQRIKYMVDNGAAILDVGGESTRPGHDKVSAELEIQRVLPVIKTIREIDSSIPISIDTQKAAVAKSALDSGASFINDISAFADPAMDVVAKEFNCSIILMRTQPTSQSVIKDVNQQFNDLIKQVESVGINRAKIILDPGLGFGDFAANDYSALPGGSPSANLELIKNIDKYSLGLPVVIGASRKRFIGELTGVESAKDRLAGSLAAAILAHQAGAAIVRVHDVAETAQAFRLLDS